jgi:hypothetical protein
MRAPTDVMAGPEGPLPLLILDRQPEPAGHRGPAGHRSPAEPVNLPVSALLSMGLSPITATTISEPPGPAPGWRLELSGRRAARLTRGRPVRRPR